jgi:hypothetical protein
MNLLQDVNQFNIKHIYFTKSIENTVLNDSYFSKIIYSNDKMMLNGIYLGITFNNYQIEKYESKQKCIFEYTSNKQLLDKLIDLELSILNKFNFSINKIKKLLMKEQLEKKFIRLYYDNHYSKLNNKLILLKISGIWENQDEIGITFKFIKC